MGGEDALDEHEPGTSAVIDMGSDDAHRAGGGRQRALVSTLNAALISGLACGALFGVIDTAMALSVTPADLTATSLLGCAAGALMQYVLVWTVGLLVAAMCLYPMLARRLASERVLALARIGLMLGIFAELYWWSRPYVFYGRNSLGAPRLLATAGIGIASAALAFALARPFLRVVLARPMALLCAIVLVAAGGFGYVWFHGGALGRRGVIDARTEHAPNVLLVVVDAMRQDTLGCYGSARVKTPRIDQLAREGVVFENAFTQAPFTWTSFGSLLTGKYPRRHGLLVMAPGFQFPSNITLPMHLHDACFDDASPQKGTCLEPDDYVGATFHTGTLSNGSRLLRGFDVYFEQMAGHGIVLADSPWSVFRSDLLIDLLGAKLRTKAGSDTAGAANTWLDAHADRRFVAMVHLYSTHTPYDPPKEFRAQYCDPAYSGPVSAFYAPVREAIEDKRFTPSAADLAQIKNLYYAGVAEADARIGMLVDTLRARGVLDDTIVIVTADHGESLGEGGLWDPSLWEHDHMVQTNLRVPLVMRWPKGLPAGARVHAITDEIDVVPTVCELIGLKAPHEEGPYGTIDGRSLLPLVRGTAPSVREFSFAENGFFAAVQDARWKLVTPVDLVESDEAAATDAVVAQKSWLVDLVADRAETNNAAAAHPDEVKRLFAALRAWSSSMPIRKADEVHSPRELKEQRHALEATGYGGKGYFPGQPRK